MNRLRTLILFALFTLATGAHARTNFYTECLPYENNNPVPYRLPLAPGNYQLPARAATADQPALPITLTVGRAVCTLRDKENYAFLQMTPVGEGVKVAKVTIVQGGRELGWLGADFRGGTPAFGKGFNWETLNLYAPMGQLERTMTYAIKPDAGVDFDPVEAFTLKVEYTATWPNTVPAVEFEVPAHWFDQYRYPLHALYEDPAEPGSSIYLMRGANGTTFAVWFTFDAESRPIWLVMPNGQPGGRDFVEGDVFLTSGPGYGAMPFDSSQFDAGKPVGRFRFTMEAVPGVMYGSTDSTPSVVFDFDVEGHRGSKSLQLLKTGSASGARCTDAQSRWNPKESGWALVTGCGPRALWATYGPDRRPTWLVADTPQVGRTCGWFNDCTFEYAGMAYEPRGSFYGAPYAPGAYHLGAAKSDFNIKRSTAGAFTFRYTPGREVNLVPFQY